jgi:tetratricopeptide (TPR) repeat protein
MRKLFSKSILSIIIITITFNFINLFIYDYKVSQFLRYDVRDINTVSDVMYDLDYYQPIEKAVVKIFKENMKDCSSINKYSNRLLSLNPRNSQAYYLIAACKDLEGKIAEAYKEIMKSIELDRYNTTYLLSLAILEIKLGKFQSSQNTLNLITSIEPNLENLEQVKQLREQKILERNN